jgi:hypothetical protein
MNLGLNRNTIIILSGVGALLGGIVALLTYINTKEHREFNTSNAKLENEIKQIDLELKKHQLNQAVQS